MDSFSCCAKTIFANNFKSKKSYHFQHVQNKNWD